MHHHYDNASPAIRWIVGISWFITAVASIFIGLMAFGYDFFGYLGRTELLWVVLPLKYIIGISGIVCLIAFFVCLGKCSTEGHR